MTLEPYRVFGMTPAWTWGWDVDGREVARLYQTMADGCRLEARSYRSNGHLGRNWRRVVARHTARHF